MTSTVEATVVNSYCYDSWRMIVEFESVQPFLEAETRYALDASRKCHNGDDCYLVYFRGTYQYIPQGRVLIEVAENGSLGYVGPAPPDRLSVLEKQVAELTATVNRMKKQLELTDGSSDESE